MRIVAIIKKAHNNYTSPTPVKWRKFGDALLGVSTTITGFAIYDNDKKIAMAALVVGVLGKFISNLFKEDSTPQQAESDEE